MKLLPIHGGYWSEVDDEDYDKVILYKWRLQRGYVVSTLPRKLGHKIIRLHRLVLNAPNGVEVDHRDHNKLNNQKSNLRLCSHSENQRNKLTPKNNLSGYKGVKLYGNSWRSQITVNNEVVYLGSFATPEEAALSYDAAARRLHGDFSRCNFPVEEK